MPPKRKASSLLLGESPTKRLTLSSKTTSTSDTPNAVRTTRSSALPVTTPRVIKTYGKQGSARRTIQATESLKENEKLGKSRSGEEKESDDELDILSPTKATPTRPRKRQLLESSTEISTPVRCTRSGKVPETPVPKPSKRRASKPTPRPQTPESTDDILPEPAIILDEPTSIPTRRVSPTKPQTAAPVRASPRKKPLAATNDGNIDHTTGRPNDSTHLTHQTENASMQTPRQLVTRGSLESTASAIEKLTVPDNASTPKIANGRSRSPDGSPLPTTLKFDSVLIPSPSTPIKKSRPKAATIPPANLLSEEAFSSVEHSAFVDTQSIPSVAPQLFSDPVPSTSPSRKKVSTVPHTQVPRVLPEYLHTCLNAQKRAILKALRHPPEEVHDEEDNDALSTNGVAVQQLTALLCGTITRGEGNSCLLLGPRGSGKSRIVEQCIASFSEENPIILRLSGWTQRSDRLAMREIAYQLSQQTGTSFMSQGDDMDIDATSSQEGHSVMDTLASSKIPPAAYLPALISVLPTLNRPSIVILDGFDLFTLHPRQALLYCLLDTAQSCRAAVGTKGLAIIGVTSRIDTVVHLEKRVKSRFSGRMIRTAPPGSLIAWENMTKTILSSEINECMDDQPLQEDIISEWRGLWAVIVEQFLQDRAVQTTWNETFSVTRDVRMLTRMLLPSILRLSPTSLSLSPSQLASTATIQRIRPRFPFLHTLPYPVVCLLIASVHADTAGQSIFTFEMLFECFRDQVRASTSAPVQVRGGSIGMVRCSRQVLVTAFEHLITIRAFIPVAAYAPSTAKEFIKYRSIIERDDIKKAVDKMNQVNLKKWLTKAAQ